MHKKGYVKLLKDRINAVRYGKKFFYCSSLNKVFLAEDVEKAESKYTGHQIEKPNFYLTLKYFVLGYTTRR